MNRHLQRKVKTGKYQSPENHPLIDGETFITEIIHRFQPMGGYVINILASQKLNITGNFSSIFSSSE